MNKKKICAFGTVVLIVVIIVTMFVNLYNEKCYWQNQVAEDNYFNWSRIYFMTEEIEKAGFTKDGIDKMWLYINAIVYSTENDVSPRFSGGTKTSYYLQTYYNSLALDISANKEWDEEKLQSAIDLFEDATMDLKNLSAEILDMASDKDGKLKLLDSDSELYKQADKLVKDYSNGYSEKILEFYEE